MSEPKEPHYFTFDFEQYRITKTLEEYLNLFSDSTGEHIAIGEGSVFYLYSSVALNKIYEFDPHAKIIVMLRNPVDLIYSFHSQLLFSADESEKNFEKAWRLQDVRRQGKEIPRKCREASFLQYAAVGRLGEQIERLFTVFPREQVEIIWFEDFICSTKQVYDRVLSFLEVNNDNRTDFIRINENKSHKLGVLGDFSEKPPALLTNIARFLNTKVTARKPLTDSLRAELKAEFTPDIKKLSQLLNKDLSPWL
jgi:hypothetical protein